MKTLLMFLLSFAGMLFAKTVDLFYEKTTDPCISEQNALFGGTCYNRAGLTKTGKMPQVRLRFIDPPELATAQFGFYL